MRRVWKWAGIGLAAVAALALLAIGYIYIASEWIIDRHYPIPAGIVHSSTSAASAVRGERLAHAYGCSDCHRPNLQTFSDADFDRAVRRGLRPDGTSVAEFMPSDAFQFMPDSDLADIVAYIRAHKPSGADVPAPSYGLVSRIGFIAGQAHTDAFWFGTQKPALDLGAHYARGRQIAMTACGECHTTALTGGPEGIPGPRPPDLSIVASYERGDFLKFMHTGKAAGNRELPMMSAVARVRISHLSDSDLNALYDYLAARGRRLSAQY